MVLMSPTFIIFIKWMTVSFEYVLKMLIDRIRSQYHISTEVDCTGLETNGVS